MKMKIPELKTAFFGFGLRPVTIFLSWISVIGGACALLGYGGVVVYGLVYAKGYYRNVYNNSNWMTPAELERTLDMRRNDILIFGGVCSLIAIYYLAISIMLTIGVHKRNHKLMIPWVLSVGIYQAAAYAFIFFTSFDDGIHINKYTFRLFLVWFVSQVYIFLIIYSHFKELKNGSDQECCLNTENLNNETFVDEKPLAIKVPDYHDNNGYHKV